MPKNLNCGCVRDFLRVRRTLPTCSLQTVSKLTANGELWFEVVVEETTLPRRTDAVSKRRDAGSVTLGRGVRRVGKILRRRRKKVLPRSGNIAISRKRGYRNLGLCSLGELVLSKY